MQSRYPKKKNSKIYKTMSQQQKKNGNQFKEKIAQQRAQKKTKSKITFPHQAWKPPLRHDHHLFISSSIPNTILIVGVLVILNVMLFQTPFIAQVIFTMYLGISSLNCYDVFSNFSRSPTTHFSSQVRSYRDLSSSD